MSAGKRVIRTLRANARVSWPALMLAWGCAIFFSGKMTFAQGESVPAGAVSLTQDPQTLTMANSDVTLVFTKRSATLTSLRYRGKELLLGGGYVQIAFTSRHDSCPLKWECRVIRQEPAIAEIAFVNVAQTCPLDFSTHFILRADESGFHNYLTLGHDAARSPGVYKLAQYNFALRIDPGIFTTAAVDDQRIVPFPKAEVLTTDRMVMDSTYHLPGGGYYSKYFFSAEMDEKHTVHGAMGDHVGIWVVMPSHEHLNGGPEHQELTVHEAGASQVLLAHATGAHYGAGIISSDSKDGSWTKVTAPWFIYINSASDQASMWRDAKQKGAEAAAQWPYRWLDASQFELHRGAVEGRLTCDATSPVADARIILAQHEEKPLPLFWQQQWRGYRFYGWADREGRFNIPKVRPGLYDLYAYQSGRFGQYVKTGVRVSAGETTILKDLLWKQPAGRNTLWQIGIPDRSAHEFGFAENFRQWGLWAQIAAAFPDGVNFVAGQSKDRDWPFEMAVVQNKDFSWRSPVWRVQFQAPAQKSRHAILTLGIASYEGKQQPQLKVSLNGEPLGSVDDLEMSGAVHRRGVHAGYQERQIIFDAGKIRPGANTMTFEIPAPTKPAGESENTPHASLEWDALRLETAD